jgi:hypothetical protein
MRFVGRGSRLFRNGAYRPHHIVNAWVVHAGIRNGSAGNGTVEQNVRSWPSRRSYPPCA